MLSNLMINEFYDLQTLARNYDEIGNHFINKKVSA